MGFWGKGNFENDIAVDWAVDFIHDPSIEFISKTLKDIFLVSDIIENQSVYRALAAAEIVACSMGKAPPDFHEVQHLITQDFIRTLLGNPQLTELAITAVDHAVNLETKWLIEDNGEPDSDAFEEWLKVQNDLKERLARRHVD